MESDGISLILGKFDHDLVLSRNDDQDSGNYPNAGPYFSLVPCLPWCNLLDNWLLTTKKSEPRNFDIFEPRNFEKIEPQNIDMNGIYNQLNQLLSEHWFLFSVWGHQSNKRDSPKESQRNVSPIHGTLEIWIPRNDHFFLGIIWAVLNLEPHFTSWFIISVGAIPFETHK